jgi:hypothetical protein
MSIFDRFRRTKRCPVWADFERSESFRAEFDRIMRKDAERDLKRISKQIERNSKRPAPLNKRTHMGMDAESQRLVDRYRRRLVEREEAERARVREALAREPRSCTCLDLDLARY